MVKSLLSDTVILFDSVSKKFTLSHNRPRGFQEIFVRLVGARAPRFVEAFWALSNVSLDIVSGEAVGFIGPNGAGKSTFLKLISGIIAPTAGRIYIQGRVAALLEVGTGFHPDLTGRENIYLNASLLGMGRTEIQSKIDQIIAFAELENYIDMPVKHYSSGMYMRLGFSVASHVDPDILVVDEVLAVGDQAFQTKCQRRVEKLGRAGVTILFVSHDLDAVRRICQRAVWMEGGSVRQDGRVEEVVDAYSRHVSAHMGIGDEAAPAVIKTHEAVKGAQRWGSREIEIIGVRLLDGDGNEAYTFATGSPMVVQINFLAHRRIEEPVFGLAVYRGDGVHVTGPNNRQAGLEVGSVEGKGTVTCQLDRLPLLTGDYTLSVAVYDRALVKAFDHHHKGYPFSVSGNRALFGLMEWPGRWELHSRG